MHLFSVYNIGIPLFLEDKSYPGIPTPRKSKSVNIPTITSGSGQKVKPLGGNIGGQKPVSTSLHPQPYFDPPFSRERELSRYTHLPGSIPVGSLDILKRMKPEGSAHDFHYLLLLKSR